ncbi:MAG: gliding motility-associated C-terminal domain-containing protein [Bacteroidetes bacterium]|nr:gliding motility-associated C-terminal domain-containing protein [Bacteroidota bacterium]
MRTVPTTFGRMFVLLAFLLPSSALSQLAIRDTVFKSTVASENPVDTTDLDLATFPGDFILDSGSSNNLARGKTASVRFAREEEELIPVQNGDPNVLFDNSTSTFFSLPAGQEGTQIVIDLQATRVVNRVKTRTFVQALNFRPRGYSILVGRDSVDLRRVLQISDNQSVTTDDLFIPDTGRYVAFQIDKMDPTRPNGAATVLSEIEVFGVGFLAEGTYVSAIKQTGSIARSVNWGKVSWQADTPPLTSVEVSLRTGDDQTGVSAWSPWSTPVNVSGSLFRVFEPRKYIQYKVKLGTQALETPRFRSIEISYDTTLVVSSATARLSQVTAEILKEANITHETAIQTNGPSGGIDTLIIETDIPMAVNAVTVNNVEVPHTLQFVPGALRVGFASPVMGTSTIRAALRFTPYLLTHSFPSLIISNATPGNPQMVDAAIIGGKEATTLVTIGVPDATIMDGRVDPNPFTPNGDGRNDVTYFNFFVANLTDPRPVRIHVFDLTGRKVRTVFETSTTAQAYVEQNAIPWDGRDDNGKLLAPGVYIFQISVAADGNNPSALTKTVTIAY